MMTAVFPHRFGTPHAIALFGALALSLPSFFPQDFTLSMLSSMGIAIILIFVCATVCWAAVQRCPLARAVARQIDQVAAASR